MPRIPGLRDLHELPREQVPALFDEIEAVSRALLDGFGAQKINVAALGNQVPQLHVHVIGRHANDAAWPGPVWNAGAATDVDAASSENGPRHCVGCWACSPFLTCTEPCTGPCTRIKVVPVGMAEVRRFS